MIDPSANSMEGTNASAASSGCTLSITIPAYLEAENLSMLLPAIKQAAAAITPSYEVLIVDTEQPMDDTAAICDTDDPCRGAW